MVFQQQLRMEWVMPCTGSCGRAAGLCQTFGDAVGQASNEDGLWLNCGGSTGAVARLPSYHQTIGIDGMCFSWNNAVQHGQQNRSSERLASIPIPLSATPIWSNAGFSATPFGGASPNDWKQLYSTYMQRSPDDASSTNAYQ